MKHRTWYLHEQYGERPYTHTRIWVYSTLANAEPCPEQPLADMLELCVDNKAGYESQAIADRQRQRLLSLHSQGYAACVDTLWIPRVHLDWLHHPDPTLRYCEAEITFSTRDRDLQRDLDFWRRFRAAVIRANEGRTYQAFQAPDAVLRALAKMRATRIYTATAEGFGTSDYCTRETTNES